MSATYIGTGKGRIKTIFYFVNDGLIWSRGEPLGVIFEDTSWTLCHGHDLPTDIAEKAYELGGRFVSERPKGKHPPLEKEFKAIYTSWKETSEKEKTRTL
jgi:hypothetical protein